MFRVVDELVDELTETAGTLPPSSLFGVRVVRATLKHSRHTMVCHAVHGLSLARLTTLLTPHLPARTPYEAQRALFLEAESHRLYASALHRCGRNFEAQRAAEDARRLYRIPIVQKAHRSAESILDLTAGQIIFHLGEPERGLEMVSRAADHLRIIHGDVLRFLKGRVLYGGLLMQQSRWEEAAVAFDEVLEISNETNNPEVRAAVVYNTSICGKRLQEEHADRCNAAALKIFKETGIATDVPRSGWMRAIDLEQQGKMKSAISELYTIRQGYIDAGLELRGHIDVTPKIVEALVAAGRFSEARKIGEHAILKLSEAGLKFVERRIRTALEVAPPEGGATLQHET